ncbi:MAG: DNA polymerase III subunit gamma/tau [Candidatus Poribacteria bacterium]|nr:DNA polymerase III subunit gamma/tau [Candidatus Poribacteria bacterium]
MSYEVLAQKWRPQSFEDVVGQTHVITTLKNQILSNRIGHAYLFWGPRGTGKTTVARILAKAVNCPNRHQETNFSQELTAEPCNQCQFCLEISQGRSFDVREMDAASNRGIDPIRELRENTRLAPAACHYKIYIIDEAHMLTQEAFNALLKTLEEPPPHVIFILATTEHHKIPKTIVSRCQDFDFRYMEQDLIVSRLSVICDAEGIHVPPEGLSLISRQSEGCLRDAENLLERLISSAGKTLDLEQIRQILGLGSNHLMGELSRAILQCNLPESIQVLGNLAKQGADLTQCLHQLIADFRALRLLAISPKLEDLIQSSKSELQLMKESADLASPERLSRIIKILMRTNSEIKQHGYAQVHFESALIDACSIQGGVSLTSALKRLAEIENRIDRGDVPNGKSLSESPPADLGSTVDRSALTPRSPASTSILGPNTDSKSVASQVLAQMTESASVNHTEREQAPVDVDMDQNRETDTRFRSVPSNVQNLLPDSDELAKIWEKLLAKLKDTKKMLLHGYLRNATLLPDEDGEFASSNGGLALKIACSPAYTELIEDAEKALLSDILTDLLGPPVQIQFVASSATANMNAKPSPRKTQETTPMMLRYEAERDPQLTPALDLFEAKILKIEPK